MGNARQHFEAFCQLVEAGDTLTAIERYYAEDVTVFENRALARAGRAKCMDFERAQLAAQPAPPRLKILRRAFDAHSQTGFIEYEIRFSSQAGRPMRLEEVAVQRWVGDKVDSERFYYEGFVDEGD